MTREEIIRDLEERAVGADCRYVALRCDVAREIVRLLREQEARVLTTEELTQIKPWTVYWGEGNHVKNLWPMAFTAEAIEDLDSGIMDDSYGRIYEVEWYNKGDMGWRLWTSRPTDEQRKAVLWDGERL